MDGGAFQPPLSRLMPCDRCGHDEHVLRCEALVDQRLDVVCPCRDVPVPGVYAPLGD